MGEGGRGRREREEVGEEGEGRGKMLKQQRFLLNI